MNTNFHCLATNFCLWCKYLFVEKRLKISRDDWWL